MRFSGAMIFVAGLLQFIVASYALLFNRLFGSARVGWSLFWAFILLALLHLVQFTIPFHNAGGVSFGNEIAVMYAIISLLLLIGNQHDWLMAESEPSKTNHLDEVEMGS